MTPPLRCYFPPENDSEIPAEITPKIDSTSTTEPPSQVNIRIPLLSDASHLWEEANVWLKEKDAKLIDAYKTSLLQEADAGPSDE
ncbi:hypothetical protein N7493_001185 [Penicillium malachiteum]|uniref:Uncharacterized protein n=1 Tax=Penicillium malachiteum TaxID=1324776 RepID=A0AAD6MZK7_9EURO|nr:hypothetical protein N7493_001185 [Penicillium malachiteum]